MPIPATDLDQRFIVATPDETLRELLARLPADRAQRIRTYIVLPVAGGRHIVVRWIEVERIALRAGRDIGERRLLDLEPSPRPVEAIDQRSASLEAAAARRDAQPGRRLVVCVGAQVIGLLTGDVWPEARIPNDPFAQKAEEAIPMPAPGDDDEPAARGDDDEPAARGDDDEPEESESLDDLPAPPMPPGLPDLPGPPTRPDLPPPVRPLPEPQPQPEVLPQPPPPDDDPRVINAWIDGITPGTSLALGQRYELKFNVDRPRSSAAAAYRIADLIRAAPADQQTVEILVVIDSDDVLIEGEHQGTLLVPRAEGSSNVLSFAISAQKPGPATIKALIIANNRVFQRMTIEARVGAAAPEQPTWKTSTHGLTMSSAMARAAAAATYMLNLTIIKKEDGYQFRVQNGGMVRAFLNLSEAQVAELIGHAREVLKQIVYTVTDRAYVYQREDTSIPAEVAAASLRELAKLGYYLYQKIFYAPGNGPDAQRMGDLLRQLSQQHQLQIEIIPERFVFPWALLYDRDPLDLSAVDPQGFWGFKHVVEYLPEFSSATTVNFTPQIEVDDTLAIGYVFNTTIDTQLARPVVMAQRDFLRALQGVTVSEYPNVQDLYNLLNDADAPPQLLYFYCHAVSNIPGDKDGVEGSQVILSDGPAPLSDLNIYAPTNRPPLKRAPLVFLNACQSAELSPYLYDGLVPYLVTRGARGVLGTEADTPAFFAAEFAQDLLRRFVAGGQTLGEVLLEVRRFYMTQKNNPLGLLYALYSSGEVVVRRRG